MAKDTDQLFPSWVFGVFGALAFAGFYFSTRGFSNNDETKPNQDTKKQKDSEPVLLPPKVTQSEGDGQISQNTAKPKDLNPSSPTQNVTPNDEEGKLVPFEPSSSPTINLNINSANINVSALYQLIEQAVKDRLASLQQEQKQLKLDYQDLREESKLTKSIIIKLFKQMGDMKVEQVDTAVTLIDLLSLITGKPLSYSEKEAIFSEYKQKSLTELINLFALDEREHLGEKTMSYLEEIKDSAHEITCLGNSPELLVDELSS